MVSRVSQVLEALWLGAGRVNTGEVRRVPDRITNPFLLTKSAHLSDRQIEELWIDFSPTAPTGTSFFRPNTPMPTIVIGGKGSGKSHLLRYYSFDVQLLRWESDGASVEDSLAQDGYIGIYTRASGLNAERFSGSGVNEQQWSAAFAYFMELWLAQELVAIIESLSTRLPGLQRAESQLAMRAAKLFGEWDGPQPATFSDLNEGLEAAQKALEYHVNQAPFERRLDAVIKCSRGALIFGLPAVLVSIIPTLKHVLFAYYIDEFENFSELQQRYVNTLVREQELPVTFRIGTRSYGMRTYLTLSAGEDIKEGSEFEQLKLDEQFRKGAHAYNTFARQLVRRRIDYTFGAERRLDLDEQFEVVADSWDSPMFKEMYGEKVGKDRRHFSHLMSALEGAPKTRQPNGISEPADVAKVVSLLAYDDYPVIEKTSLYIFYQAWTKNEHLLEAAELIRQLALEFVQGERKGRFKEVLSHFKNDFIAQIRRDTKNPDVYTGIETFIEMSEGLPRVLITLLKHIYSWAVFRRENPFRGGKVSVEAQRAGVSDASEWFLNDMRKAGREGLQIRSAIDRLAEVFRINHFADKPSECSLIAFSVDLTMLQDRARQTLSDAENRSFLVRIAAGEQDRNTKKVTAKYQLSRMICPYFSLPVARRGTARFAPAEATAVFVKEEHEAFERVVRVWEKRMNAPFAAARRRKKPPVEPEEPGLFK